MPDRPSGPSVGAPGPVCRTARLPTTGAPALSGPPSRDTGGASESGGRPTCPHRLRDPTPLVRSLFQPRGPGRDPPTLWNGLCSGYGGAGSSAVHPTLDCKPTTKPRCAVRNFSLSAIPAGTDPHLRWSSSTIVVVGSSVERRTAGTEGGRVVGVPPRSGGRAHIGVGQWVVA